MTNRLLNDLLPALKGDPRVENARIDGDDLVLLIGGEGVRISADAEHQRTVCWAQIRRLSPGEAAGGARAARRYNAGRGAATGNTMGLHVEGNALILGRSVDAGTIAAAAAVEIARELGRALADARSLLDEVLEEMRREASRRMAAEGLVVRA